jgi:hypothetical protein
VPLVAGLLACGTVLAYRFGARSISRSGVVIAIVIVAAALASSLVATLIFDRLRAFVAVWDLAWWPALSSQEFGYFVVRHALFSAELWAHYVPLIALGALLAGFGCWAGLRMPSVFRAAVFSAAVFRR